MDNVQLRGLTIVFEAKQQLKTSPNPTLEKFTGELEAWLKADGGYSGEKGFSTIGPWILYELQDMTDAVYLQMDAWAFGVIKNLKGKYVDIGSKLDYISMIGQILPVEFVDVRPLKCELEGVISKVGKGEAMPYEDSSVDVVSCLHAAEHFGLGRYGDDLDPMGTEKACTEFERIVKPGGSIVFAVPAGPPCIQFNAHRIFSKQMVLDMFPGCDVKEELFMDGKSPNPCAEGSLVMNVAIGESGLYGVHLVKR